MKVRSCRENFEKALELQEGYRDACEKLADYYRENMRISTNGPILTLLSPISAVRSRLRELLLSAHRGLIYMNAMELDEAIRDFEKALGVCPEDWAAHKSWGAAISIWAV